jgi:hypothetical protein
MGLYRQEWVVLVMVSAWTMLYVYLSWGLPLCNCVPVDQAFKSLHPHVWHLANQCVRAVRALSGTDTAVPSRDLSASYCQRDIPKCW